MPCARLHTGPSAIRPHAGRRPALEAPSSRRSDHRWARRLRWIPSHIRSAKADEKSAEGERSTLLHPGAAVEERRDAVRHSRSSIKSVKMSRKHHALMNTPPKSCCISRIPAERFHRVGTRQCDLGKRTSKSLAHGKVPLEVLQSCLPEQCGRPASGVFAPYVQGLRKRPPGNESRTPEDSINVGKSPVQIGFVLEMRGFVRDTIIGRLLQILLRRQQHDTETGPQHDMET